MRKSSTEYSRNVFINCPFDPSYWAFFERQLFIIGFLGFNPIFSRTKTISTSRLDTIRDLIQQSQLSIHDLSIDRLNMPLELGLDLGCATWSPANRDKHIMAMFDKEHEHYVRASDLSGIDPIFHDGSPEVLFSILPAWFNEITNIVYPDESYLASKFGQWEIQRTRIYQAANHIVPKGSIPTRNVYLNVLQKWIAQKIKSGEIEDYTTR